MNVSVNMLTLKLLMIQRGKLKECRYSGMKVEYPFCFTFPWSVKVAYNYGV